ncbi:hypothetical protein OBE_13536, partial [human gut metagenome]
MERHCFRVLSDYHNLLRRWKRDCPVLAAGEALGVEQLVVSRGAGQA